MENHFISNPAVDLGPTGYDEALRIQKKAVLAVKRGYIDRALLFLEHPPVYTVGRKPVPENYIGIIPVATERGGDITYHGPGQLVIYPILDVRTDGRRDIRAFVNRIMEAAIGALSTCGVSAEKGENEPGIWCNGMKIGSVGIAVDENVSYHGVSINISKSVLDGFSRIRPCGMDPSVMSFVQVERDRLIEALISVFSGKFGLFGKIPREEFLEGLSGLPSNLPDPLRDSFPQVGGERLHKEERG